jgi:MFS family permease
MMGTGIKFGHFDDRISAILAYAPIAVAEMLGTFTSAFLIDRFGRRYLIVRALPLIMASWLLVAYGQFILPVSRNGGYLALVGMVLSVFLFGVGLESTVFAVCSEIFPMHVIGTAESITSTVNFASNYILCQTIPLLI